MDPFTPFSIPVLGLKIGMHNYQYVLDGSFFRHFEDSLIDVSEVRCTLELEKRSDMLVLDFVLEGWAEAVCDRCTATIKLPIVNEKQLLVKLSEEEDVEEEDEVVFISREVSHFNVAPYLYEFSILALPITNIIEDCENLQDPPCNQEILRFLKPEDGPDDENSVWDVLKDLNKN
ncbi:MAG: DUF177 domain-containing protein [Lewinellaceae bacterium]|nr:DUF177 domain-containing protein [Lewinellaceae bacterium]